MFNHREKALRVKYKSSSWATNTTRSYNQQLKSTRKGSFVLYSCYTGILFFPSSPIFLRTCILPEVIGKWYTRKHFSPQGQSNKQPETGAFALAERTLTRKVFLVVILNVPLFLFLKDTLYLIELQKNQGKQKVKNQRKKKKSPIAPSPEMSFDFYLHV